MLDRYKILERIGSGGFGVVHRAEDQVLKRHVAIKFLAQESFKKEHMRVRFEREARLAASLNHPNICTVHEVGEAAPGDEMVLGGDPQIRPGTPFIVMELLEGRPLDRILDEDGALPLPRLIEIAVEVANGLVEAHSHSIVHRDLKPKNVVVAPNGRAKILDFGMAKPLTPGPADDETTMKAETHSLELTREGMVLGTVAYMSPEQATGKAVDSRSDVFAFGVMLYEMATGRKPFEGDSLTSTLAKILETEPPSLAESREDLPLEFSRIIRRCLRKSPADRYNDTRDLAVALKDLMVDTSSGTVRRMDAVAATSGQVAIATAKTGPRIALWAVAGAAVVLAGLAVAFFAPKLFRSSRRFAAPSFAQVSFTGSASYPTLSPDGQSVAYATSRPGGGQQVLIQDLAGGQQLSIFEGTGIRSLRWSPSGTELLVSGSSAKEANQTYIVSRLGGSKRPLRYLPFVAWSPKGDRFAGATLSGKQIWFTETTTGDVSSIDLTGTFSFIYELDWSPLGAVLAFRTSDESGRHAIWTTTIDGGKQQIVVAGAESLYSPRFSAQGDAIYYLSGVEQAKSLRKIEIDPRTGEPVGEPILLLDGLQAGDQMALSSDGRRLLYAREASHTNLWLVDARREGAPEQLTRGTFRHSAPRFSPDGASLALIRESRSGPNVFVMSLAEGTVEQLTFLTANIWQPVWSPDGDEIAFGSTMGDAPRVWKIGARGGTPRPFTTSSLSRDLVWAPGSRILYQRPGDSAFHYLDPETGDEKPLLDDSGGGSADPLQFFSWMASPEYSPDGRQVAISCNCPDGEGVWVVTLADSSRHLIHDDSQALPVGWSADGASVYALKPETLALLRIPTRGGAAETYVNLPFERVAEIDVAPDGNRIAVAVPVTQADIWLIENFDPS